jgi:hypothetical protein
MNEHLRFYPQIDYRAHPAFRDLGVQPRDDDAIVDEMIGRIDTALEAIHGSQHDPPGLRAAFETGPVRRMTELAAYLDRTTPNERLRGMLSRAFADVRGELWNEVQIHNDRHSFSRHLTPGAQAVASDLERDGAHICRIPEAERRKLWALCSPIVARLRAATVNDTKSRFAESIPRYSTIGVRLNRFFVKSGILDGLSCYFGSNVQFAGFSLEYSNESQVWWRDLYADVGLSNAKASYFHYDHGCRNPKAIIALSEVNERNGPTGYVLGSHKKPRSTFVHFLIKSIDYSFVDDKPAEAKGFYRRRFQGSDYRREFLMLPAALQGCSHFGEDVMDNTALSAELLSREVKLTHDVGNCVVFDGDYGIHRGAMVSSGDRFVFQVIFAIESNTPTLTALKQRARSMVRSLIKGN